MASAAITTFVHGFSFDSSGRPRSNLPDSGGIRTATPEARAVADFEGIVEGVCRSAGGSYYLDIEIQNPSIYNDPGMVELLQAAGIKVLGAENVQEFEQTMPGGDDAALFQQKVPGVYWQPGARNEAKGFDKPGDSPYFDFDEDAPPLGAAVHAQAVEDFLLR